VKALFASTILAVAFLPAQALGLDPLSGAARVAGPATLVVKGGRVRLAGLDPDLAIAACAGRPQACTEAAEGALSTLIAGIEVTCQPDRRLGHGSFLGTCTLPDGSDIAERLIEQGWGVPGADAPNELRDGAIKAERAALGLWATGS
jgi:endonuclease YncB( thermonuclease family)